MRIFFVLLVLSPMISADELPKTMSKCYDSTPLVLSKDLNDFTFTKEITRYNTGDDEIESVFLFAKQSFKDKSRRFSLTSTIKGKTFRIIRPGDTLYVSAIKGRKKLELSSNNGNIYTLHCDNGCNHEELKALKNSGLSYSDQKNKKQMTCIEFLVEGV